MAAAQGRSPSAKQEELAISPAMEVNIERLKRAFGGSGDLTVRYFRPGAAPELTTALVYVDGLVDPGCSGS
ncbi:MAG TPA: spore germination protein [Firmicutes bacterium]|nr:spore germination protein [Bacillota bacterium]